MSHLSSQKIAVAALNPVLGDIDKNLKKIEQAVEHARSDGADLIIFSEMTLTGYPGEDFWQTTSFLKKAEQAIDTLRQQSEQIAILVGAPEISREGIYNSAFFLAHQEIQAIYRKRYLPNYGVFDERRYFVPGSEPCVVEYQGIRYGILICEDLWYSDPNEETAQAGADVILSIHASPYDVYKHGLRSKILSRRAREIKKPMVYVHHVGGQDELIFDGGSMAVDASGQRLFQAPFFHPDVSLLTLSRGADQQIKIQPGPLLPAPTLEESLHQALVLGTRDYCEKNGISQVILGLSGGIDSAVSLKIAVDALGPENTTAWMMPSRYTQPMSVEDAQKLSEILGNRFAIHPIDSIWASYDAAIPSLFTEHDTLVTENIQARIRGNLLMAHSNQTGALLINTGNKSELATGYCTLYGDMAGGFAILKDLWKTWVYKVAHYLNQGQAIFPERILTRPPSAELKPHQTDEAALLPYPVLDTILKAYVEERKSFEEILDIHPEPEQVRRILNLVLKSEYKRKQAPIGIRVTPRAFGKDWRYPITHGITY